MQRSRLSDYSVLVGGLVLTALGVVAFERTVEERDTARFQSAVIVTQDLIRDRLDAHVALLLSARSFMEAGPLPDRDRFQRFVAGLDVQHRYPGLQGIGWAVRVTPEQHMQLERQQQEGSPGFRIWPAGKRAEYFPITYLEPLDRRNRAALGYDMFSELARRAAMTRARDSGAPAATRQLTLVQEIDVEKQPGFLIYVPVYRGAPPDAAERASALVGFVYSPFRVEDLFRGVFRAHPEPRLAFEVFDGAIGQKGAPIYRSGAEPRASSKARFNSVAEIDVAGTTWSFVFHSTPAFDAGSSRSLGWALGLLGLGLSSALFLLTRAEVNARSRAEASEAALERERSRLSTVFTEAPAAIALIRASDKRFELSNAINEEYAGGRKMVGLTMQEALPELADQGLSAQMDRVIATGEPFIATELPVRIHESDGSERVRYVNGIYQPIRGPRGDVESIMVFAYDVTGLVTSRVTAETLAKELKRAVSIRDDFLSIAGHELRTPLTALTLQVQGLQRQLRHPKGSPTTQTFERLNKAAGQIERLNRLVSELLDVSRLSSGRLVLESEDVDLGALIDDVVERFDDQAARAGCSFVVRHTAHVRGQWDRARLDQVITNLIGNALKYGAGKPVEITVSADARQAQVAVRDYGIGVPSTDVSRIFGRFERAAPKQHYGGLGLGLWISTEIVKAHAGSIELESEEGVGSTFTVRLPLPRTESFPSPIRFRARG
jgi:signal transduction histidine kinase